MCLYKHVYSYVCVYKYIHEDGDREVIALMADMGISVCIYVCVDTYVYIDGAWDVMVPMAGLYMSVYRCIHMYICTCIYI